MGQGVADPPREQVGQKMDHLVKNGVGMLPPKHRGKLATAVYSDRWEKGCFWWAALYFFLKKIVRLPVFCWGAMAGLWWLSHEQFSAFCVI